MNEAARTVSSNSKTPVTINTYRIDCSLPLPSSVDGSSAYAGDSASSKSVYDRFRIGRLAQPAFFVVGNGKNPVQLPPTISYNATEIASAIKSSGILTSRHTRIDNDADLSACIKDRSGGCMIVYTSKDSKELAADLLPIVEEHRTIQFAVLRSNQLHLKAQGGAVQELIKEAVGEARAVTSASRGKEKGSVLIHIKRVPSHLNGGVSGGLLTSVGWSESGVVVEQDVIDVLESAREATDKLKAAAGAAAGSDAIDSLLQREDDLKQLGAAIVTRGELSITRARVKAKPTPKPSQYSASSPDGDEDDSERPELGGGRYKDQLDRQKRRAAERNERRDKQDADEAAARAAERAAEAALSPEEKAERQREFERKRRAEMAAEEAESAHFAAAAEEADAEAEAGTAFGDDSHQHDAAQANRHGHHHHHHQEETAEEEESAEVHDMEDDYEL